MRFNHLKTSAKTILATCVFALLVTSCNNSDESANNSTDKKEDAVVKEATPATKKKTGKASTSMNSDDTKIAMTKDKDGIYNRSEVLPSFEGGQTAIDNYVIKNIEYPQDAIDNDVQGVVKVQFAVDEKGNVSNVSTQGPKLGYGLEEESVRVVSGMKWNAGEIKGKKVKTWRTLPINYRLES